MVLPRGGNVRHHNQPFGNTRAYPLGGVICQHTFTAHNKKNDSTSPISISPKILQNAPSFVSFFECFFAQHIPKNKILRV